MGALMSALGKMDFGKLQKVGQIESMNITWKQTDENDSSTIKMNIESTPMNPEFGEVFLEMFKMVAGDKVTIQKVE